MITVYKYRNGYSSEIMNGILNLRGNVCNLGHFHVFQTDNSRSLKYGLNGFPYCVSQLWQLVLTGIRKVCSLALLKDRMKNSKCVNCPYRSCKPFIENAGSI